MKRLIALLVGIAVLMSMSLTSFAAFSDVIEVNTDGITYTAALSSEAATANAGKQTTIVAYKGDKIAVGSIQYIDQAAATSFTFQLKDELTEDVKVVMGGELIDKQEIGTIKYGSTEPDPTPTPDPTYAVSGSITTTSANKDFTAKLYAGEDVAYEAVVTAGTYAFADVKAGDYTLVIEKAAHITYTSDVTISGAKEIAAIDMIVGDTNSDDIVGLSDYIAIGENYNSTLSTATEDAPFDAECDTNGDDIIGLSDYLPIGENYNATTDDYSAIQ